MNQIKTVPAGCVEYTPQDFDNFNSLRERILTVYQTFGYNRIETSIMQFLDVLISEGSVSKEVYSIERAKNEEGVSESNRGLRFDLTKPLARYVSQNQSKLVFPFKRSEAGLVYRGERPQKGRLRQFYQLDFDVIGIDNLAIDYDAEVVEVITSTFEELKIGNFVVRVNNRKLLQGILEFYGVLESDFVTVLGIIDKLEKIGLDACLLALTDEVGLEVNSAKTLLEIVSKSCDLATVSELLSKLPSNPLLEVGKSEILKLAELLDFSSLQLGKVVLDLSIARGLSYYTGFVCETNLVGFERYGSICSGGRYADLASEFTDSKLPGVGASIGLSRLFTILQDNNLLNFESESKKVYFAVADSSRTKKTREIAQLIRKQAKVQVEVAASEMKVKKQIATANKLKSTFFVILEENGLLSVKDMESGQQSELSLETFLQMLN